MSSANPLVPLALALYAPAIWLAIRSLGPGRGVLASLLGGWLFLPVFDGQVDVPLIAGKVVFVPTVLLVVSVVVDLPRWLRLRPRRIDLVAAAVCAAPFFTALANDLGAYEGGSAAFAAFCTWVAPYLLGRAYAGAPTSLRLFAAWLVGAALIYTPLCLWEIRMSPQLHRVVYGFRAAGFFGMAYRWGGYRPSVFMANGLAVGIFMATATLVAYWLWRTRAVPRVLWIPTGAATLILAATTVLVKSTGAIVLLAVGVLVLETSRLLRSFLPILALALLPVVFCAVRMTGWTADEVVRMAETLNPERSQSLAYRVEQEQALLDKAAQRPWLGWGRWGRSRIYDRDGRDVSVTDSLWIIELGTGGRIGLLSLGLLLLLPAWLLLGRFPARRLVHPRLAPAFALSMASLLWVTDSLLNNMNGPLYPAMAGATVSFLAYRWPRRRHAPVRAERSGPGAARPGAWGPQPVDRS